DRPSGVSKAFVNNRIPAHAHRRTAQGGTTMLKKLLLSAVALLGIAGAAHADEFRGRFEQQRAPFARFDRNDYWRMREGRRFERMRRIRWEREHRYRGGYGWRW